MRRVQTIAYEQMFSQFHRVLTATGFVGDDAHMLARVFADNSRDGVPSHGLNRFPGFIRDVNSGRVDLVARAEPVAALGAMEQWDGHRGPGVLNGMASMGRAIELARQYTVGAVALRNTSHWMRAGAYGMLAADAGCIGICWTNTSRLMPPHGGLDKRLGNNPLVLAIPRPNGDHVLLDMAMTQFSGGRTGIHARTGEPLPVPGGYDRDGQLTTDAGAIERALPIGHWKGSGLALCLDLVAALLSGGQTTTQISRQDNEAGVSQVYLAFDLDRLGNAEEIAAMVRESLTELASGQSLPGEQVTWPGQRSAGKRRDALRDGIPVEWEFWEEVLAL
jgi:3-dehydro-L-gulonate 2-dehydrogenase